jgi:hypothetical protein
MSNLRWYVPTFGGIGLVGLAATVAALPVVLFACAASHEDSAVPVADSGVDAPHFDTSPGDTTPPTFDVAPDAPPDTAPPPDPTTCDEAKTSKTYLGCDFWPTVTANRVWNVFDFAAIVANAGDVEARVTVTGPGGFSKEAIVGPNRLVKIYLPWVPALKGPEGDSCGIGEGLTASVRADKSAYHVVTTRPVAVYQFNALEFKGEGGPGGKSWASCPGDDICKMPDGTITLPLGCFSFTNDASLLLPTTALTGNYRVTAQHGAGGANPFIALTGVEDGTDITITLGAKSRIIAGDGIVATSAGKEAKFKLDQGDVLELIGGASVSSDFSGSLIQATKPIQVVSGVPCIQQPIGIDACDHVEESVFPAETLGKHYVVTVPTGPNGDVVGHIVRIYGNVDGTTLTYKPAAPKGAPTTINAGGVYDLAVVSDDFEVTGDQSFAVGSFMLGGTLLDPSPPDGIAKGDPSQSMISAVEQFRLKYVFLAPDDYPVSYVDVVGPDGTKLTLDGDAVSEIATPIGTTGYGVTRILLGAGEVGAHLLTATKPIGIQVMGYGEFTSYQYPGGLNLQAIAPPPVK